MYMNIYPLPINYRPQGEIINSNGTKMIMYVYNKPYLHNVISVLVNFSANSYRAEVDATSVTVRVMAFGSFYFPFLLEVIPKTVDTPEGNDTVTLHFGIPFIFQEISYFLMMTLKKCYFHFVFILLL